MLETIFLISLGLIWIIFAVIQDIKKREIANWLNFSLAIFALGFRFFYSLFGDLGYGFFYQGLIGFGVFFLLGNLFYYGKVFAGGDAKLMISLGAVIPFSESIFANLNLVVLFFSLFLFAGAIYGVVSSLFLGIKNRKKFVKEFSKQLDSRKKFICVFLLFGIIFLALSFFEFICISLAILFFVLPYLYLAAKAIDESCMVKRVNTKNLTEGDWLYRDIRFSRKLIKARWDGLSKEEINLIRRKKRIVLIRQGIPFSPVFLISYLVLIFILFFKQPYVL